ncbi:hypothetical protein LX92_04124 [Maribacter polysiphoniae]|uniref:Uncharacterized protein n=1 Tax=Maribacter polysiphoniae TaxID=429344 RepID=A0A316DQ27_9FLAO|nr:hypothetical protein LX92_04124 [Maribacter polysiphoniae]
MGVNRMGLGMDLSFLYCLEEADITAINATQTGHKYFMEVGIFNLYLRNLRILIKDNRF